jgi:membrane protease YdiL (CAAX protease family)
MFNGAFNSLSPLSKILFSLFIIFSSLLFSLIVGSILAIPIFGINFFTNPELLADVNNLDYLPFFKYFQLVQSIGLFIIPPIIAAKLFGNSVKNYYGFHIKPLWIFLVLAFLMMFTIQPLITYLIELNNNISFPESLRSVEIWMKNAEANAAKLSEMFLLMNSPFDFVLNIIIMAVIPAIGEELLFRGLFQRLLHEWTKNIHIAVILTAIIFSAIHLQFYGFFPRFLLGALFGYLFVWSGTLWLPIFAHFINNASAVIISYLWQNGIVNNNYESFGNFSENYSAVILSVVLSIIMIYHFYKISLKNKSL